MSRPIRTLVVFGSLIAVGFMALFAGVTWADATFTPKLALDLEGGTQIILTPVATDDTAVTPEVIDQSISIIRQRVDATGVAEAEITSQGGSNIVVSIPGEPDEATLDLVRTPAVMEFRSVIVVAAGVPVESDDLSSLPTDEDLAAELAENPEVLDPSSFGWITQELQAEFDALDCTDTDAVLESSRQARDPNRGMAACSDDGFAKFVLGPLEIHGVNIDQASSGLGQSGQVTTNQWVVSLEFDRVGADLFRTTTTRLLSLPSPRNQFAMVLDGMVISAPQVNEVIPNGQAQISGSFNQVTAAALAQQLNFGALPLSFEVQSEQQISATLGSEQLQRGLLAGALGLLLVVVYLLFQYRALGLVTVASLGAAGVLVYLTITIMSSVMGYRLSLPGVAGIIVAIGFTADSFILYFERIRDELRDGRPLPVAIDRAWLRAKRTILASDAVNLLAAIVLYNLAVGGVQGFAVMLGVTTVIDIIIVFFFTHPLLLLIARSKFFAGGHAASGLSAERLGLRGPRYVGRGRVVGPDEKADRASVPTAPGSAPSPLAADDDAVGLDQPQAAPEPVPARAASRRGAAKAGAGATATMTIAERRAAEKAARAETEGEEG